MKIDHIKLLADYFPAIKQRDPVRKTSLIQKNERPIIRKAF